MKKAVALFLTLIFITIVMAILGGIFAIYQKFTKNTFYKDISQNSVLIYNTKSILDKLSEDINGSSVQSIFTTIPISSKDGNFRALITIKPMFDRVDINEINKNKYIKKYLENILEYYQIADPLFFEDLILDSLDLDKKERVGGSEIILKNPFFKQGKIYNYTQFKEILNYYSKIMDDKSVYKIPWRKLFIFGNGNSIIDCNLMKKNVAKFLGLEYNENISCKSLETFAENKKIMQNFSIMPFSKKRDYLIKVNILYNEENLSFVYNISKKRIENIKNNILY